MRLARVTPYAAAVALLALSPAALAAPKSCNLLVDPRGDDHATSDHTTTPQTEDVYDSSDLDVVSADVATNAKYLTAVVRTTTLQESDPESPTGRMWQLMFVVGEQRYVMSAMLAPDGSRGAVYRETADYEEGGYGATAGEGIGPAAVSFDFKRREVRMTAPLSLFAPYASISKGRVIRNLDVWTFHFYGTGGGRVETPVADWVVDWGGGGFAHSVDHGAGTKSYVAGSPSCVAVPR